jgi:ferredoxin-nitrate reductase
MGYHGEGNWPVRVDEYVSAPVDHWVQSACVMCSNGKSSSTSVERYILIVSQDAGKLNGDSFMNWVDVNDYRADIGVSKDNKIVGIRGREVDRINKGRLGPKGMCSWEYNHHPDRLTFPVSPSSLCSFYLIC